MSLKSYQNRTLLALALLALPVAVLADDYRGGTGVKFGATIFSVCNFLLFCTSVTSIRQFFWPGFENRMPFHIFNIVFAVLFYAAGLPFLISNQQYYIGYEDLTPAGVIGKFFFTLDITSAAQWVIAVALVCNVLYIIRNYRDYFDAGLVKDTRDAAPPKPEQGSVVDVRADEHTDTVAFTETTR